LKALLINGSPHEHGSTAAALAEIAATLEQNGVETVTLWLGTEAIHGCTGCGACRSLGCCVFDDAVNRAAELAKDCDAYVFGSPVHYAGASGAIISFLDRFYFCGGDHSHKPCAVAVAARRGGTTAAIEQLTKYPTYARQPLVSGHYWPMVHGNSADEVRQDAEGMSVMRDIGRNMAWLLHCIEAGCKAGIEPPAREIPMVKTNFIR